MTMADGRAENIRRRPQVFLADAALAMRGGDA